MLSNQCQGAWTKTLTTKVQRDTRPAPLVNKASAVNRHYYYYHYYYYHYYYYHYHCLDFLPFFSDFTTNSTVTLQYRHCHHC